MKNYYIAEAKDFAMQNQKQLEKLKEVTGDKITYNALLTSNQQIIELLEKALSK